MNNIIGMTSNKDIVGTATLTTTTQINGTKEYMNNGKYREAINDELQERKGHSSG